MVTSAQGPAAAPSSDAKRSTGSGSASPVAAQSPPATGDVTLDGNVVLTRGQNVIRGARLLSNRRTGQSTVYAAAPGSIGKPEQRVRALFKPESRPQQPARKP